MAKADDQNHSSQFKFKRQILRSDAPAASPRPSLQSPIFSTTGKQLGDSLRGTQVAPYGASLPPSANSQRRLVVHQRMQSPPDETKFQLPCATRSGDLALPEAVKPQASSLGDPQMAQSPPMSQNNARLFLGKHLSASPAQRTVGNNLSNRFDTGFNNPQDDNASYMPNRASSSLSYTVPSVTPKPIPSSMHNNFMPSSHSRSASVVSSTLGRQDEDISSIMMRGATDLRNTKYEVEEQRREILFLQDQLETAKSEKDEALKRLQAVKDAAKHSLESSSKSLNDLQSTLTDLKTKSDDSFAVVSAVRKSLPDVQELRVSISEAIKNIEPLLGEDGHLSRTSETMALVSNLELECTKSQQVSDLLRDRLQSVGSELIDAKGRVIELEAAQAANREALRASACSVSTTTQQVTELAECLKKQQGEMYEVLSTAADAEAKLAASNQRMEQLENLVAEKNVELQALHEVQQENARLLNALQDRDARLSSLGDIQQELSTVQSTLNERHTKVSALEACALLREEDISHLKSSSAQVQAQLEEAKAVGQSLREDLRACELREQAALEERERHSSDGRALQVRLEALESQLEQARRELEARSEKLHQANSRCQVLEERFDDQSVTMKLTREANGDLQERLVAAEAKFARDFETAVAKLNCDIVSLDQQKLHLQSKIDDLSEHLKRQEEASLALKTEHAGQLKHQDEMFRMRLEAEEKRAGRAERELDTSQVLTESLREKLSGHADEIHCLREELKKAKLPSPAHEAELKTLRSEIDALQTAKEKLLERAKTIDIRYRKGDLTDEEKVFLNGLMQTWKDIHEKGLVAKGNELRRRDNVIKDLRSKIYMLESSLAKHLQLQENAKVVENRSMIDPTAWMSASALSSSPAATGPQAPDRDAPSTNVDSTTTARPTPAPVRPQPIRTNAVPQAAPTRVTPTRFLVANAKVISTAPKISAAAFVSPVPTSPEITIPKPIFSRLATDSSDEILDFEDGATHRLSPAVKLGKRDNMSSPPKDTEARSIPRPSKRLRATTRKPEERVNEEQVKSTSKLKKNMGIDVVLPAY
ncbi:hypothetical protein BKA93DRAFT_821394 [Sparassis latifolia]